MSRYAEKFHKGCGALGWNSFPTPQAALSQPFELPDSFDAFRDHDEFEAFAERQNRVRHRREPRGNAALASAPHAERIGRGRHLAYLGPKQRQRVGPRR